MTSRQHRRYHYGHSQHSWADQQVGIAALDQESFLNALDDGTWPFDANPSFGRDPDAYLRDLQLFAQQVTDGGGSALIVFVHPAEYVDWCRQNGCLPGQQTAAATYIDERLEADDALLYSQGMSLVNLGVTAMAIRSEVYCGEPTDPLWEQARTQADLIMDRIVGWVAHIPGEYRVVVTANRYADHNKHGLWEHFRGILADPAGTLHHCGDFLSVRCQVSQQQGSVTSQTGDGTIPILLRLAAMSHGLLGVEHRPAADPPTLRCWQITSPQGAQQVEPNELAQHLDSWDHVPLLRSDWPVR